MKMNNRHSTKTVVLHYLLLVAVLILAVIPMPTAKADISLDPFDERKIFEPSPKSDMPDFIKADFNPKYGVIRLSKTFLWIETDKIAEYSLTHNTDQCLVDCEAQGKAVLYADGRLFDDVNFNDKFGSNVEINSAKFFIYNITTYEVDVPDEVNRVCDNKTKEITIDNKCWDDILSWKKETRQDTSWVEYKGEDLPSGEYTWKIEGKKKPMESIDWITEKGGKEFTEWAWWNSNWVYKKAINISVSVGSTTTAYEATINITHDGTMDKSFKDIRFLNSSEGEELNFWIENYTYDESALVWVRINDTINTNNKVVAYMYYGNAADIGNASNASRTFIFGDDFSANTSARYDTVTDGAIIDRFNWSNAGYCSQSGSVAGHLVQIHLSPNLSINDNQRMITRVMPITGAGNSNPGIGVFDGINQYNDVIAAVYSETLGNKFAIYGIEAAAGFGKNKSYSATLDRWWTLELIKNGNVYNFSSTNSTNAWSDNLTKDPNNFTYTSSGFINRPNLTLFHYTQNTIARWDYILVASYVPGKFTTKFGDETSFLGTILNAPINYYNSTFSTIYFNCTAEKDAGGVILNLTLIINGTDYYTLFNSSANQMNLSLNQSATFSEGFGNWTCRAADDTTSITAATQYFNVSTIPFINYFTPTPVNYFNASFNSLYINVTFNNTYFKNITFDLFNTSGLYESNFSDTYITHHNFTGIRDGNYTYNVTIWTNTSQTNHTVNRNITIDISAPTVNISIPSGTLYQPPYNFFDLNYTVSDANIKNCSYSYNGAANISHSCSVNFTGINFTRHGSNTITLYVNDTGGNINSSTRTFYVFPTMARCNGTFSEKHTLLNFSFKDESTNLNMNASIDSATFYIWYDDQNNNLTYLYSNATENRNYTFCVYPNWTQNISMSYTLKYSSDTYSSTSYPIRTYAQNSVTYTNASINAILLYLLSSSDGIYSTILTQTSGGVSIPGVLIQVEREIGGIWTILTQGTTDDSGAVTFWVNPNFQHKITATKTGYASETVYVYPTQASYTIVMGGTGGGGIYYSHYLEGLTYSFYPRSGPHETGYYNFSFVVYYDNPSGLVLQNCSLSLLNSTREIVNTTYHLTNDTTCRPIFSAYYFNESRYGRFSVKINDTWIILESDANWRNWAPNWTGLGLSNFINSSIFLEEWGDNPETNDFSRIVFFFLIMAVILSGLNFYTKYDTQYPGASMYLLWGAILLGTFANGILGPGFFYLDIMNIHPLVFDASTGAYSMDETNINYIAQAGNNSFIAIMATMITISMLISNWRRQEGG